MDYQNMGMATDMANPAFANPQNPDSLLHVEFYWHEPEDVHKSEAAGKIVRGPKQPYVRIQKPGDTTSIIEVAVREDHKRRWPEKWLYWQMREGLIEGAGDIPGWKVEEWTYLTKEQVHELKYLRFSTVEQIAGASDAQVQRMGLSGLSLRENARQALKARMGAETREALQQKEAEIAELKRGQDEMRAQMAELLALLKPKVATPDPEPIRDPEPEPQPLFDTTGEREALVAAYEIKFGKKPHWKVSNDKIKAELNA